MTEDFLHFIWQYQYFDKKDLNTTTQMPLEILDIGKNNRDAGADFQQARLLLDGVEWVGNVEIHLKSSDWNVHKHQQDPAYNNVILHVVWQDDKPVHRADQTPLPTLELKERVDKQWLYKYQGLLESKAPIPCAAFFPTADPLKKTMMLDKALAQRLETKAFLGKALLVKNKQDWEETAYQVLAKNFGFKINAEPFLRLSQAIPYKLLMKHKDKLMQMEALLLGQAGLLPENTEENDVEELKKEYAFLSKKYHLDVTQMEKSAWNFLRLRPANFPTLRIAQFAAFIHQNENVFQKLIHQELPEIKEMFSFQTSVYWQKHYTFGKKAGKNIPPFGSESLRNILINTVVPLLACYAREKDRQDLMDKAVHLLESQRAEDNKIIRTWQSLGVKVNSAFDSQALIELYNEFCTPKKCLQCAIGHDLLKKES